MKKQKAKIIGIQLKEEVRKKLAEAKIVPRESYNDCIARLLNQRE